MLKQQAKLLRKIAIITDFIAINAAFALACHVRHLGSDLVSLKEYSWVLLPVVPVWYFLLNHFGFYASLRTRSFLSILASLTKIQTIGGIVTSSVIYFVEPHGFSRALFGEFLVFSYLFLLLEKSILKAGQAYLRKRGYNTRNILIVGTNGKSREFINLLEKHTDWGLKVVGFLQVADEPAMTTVSGYNVLGRIENHKQICRFYSVDEVVFCLPMKDMVDVDDILRDMEETGVTVRMMLSFFENRGTRKELSIFQNQIPFLTFYSKPFNSSQLFLKRCLDIFGALIG